MRGITLEFTGRGEHAGGSVGGRRLEADVWRMNVGFRGAENRYGVVVDELVLVLGQLAVGNQVTLHASL